MQKESAMAPKTLNHLCHPKAPPGYPCEDELHTFSILLLFTKLHPEAKICIFRPARTVGGQNATRCNVFTVRSVLSETEALGDIGDFCGREMSGYQ